MKKSVSENMASGLDKVNVDTTDKFCESYVLGKQTKLPFSAKNVTRSNRVLELIHTDVYGPVSEAAYDGSRYFVTFTDDYSRASMIYCMERKSEVFEKFKEFVAMVEAEHCKRVKRLDCSSIAKLKAENGGEYVSKELKDFCKERGIRIYTVPNNPEMNGVAERLNRTLVDKVRTMLLAAKLPKRFWNEAVVTANHIKNRSPTSACGDQFKCKTPAEIWYNKKPDLSHIKVFGSICYNHVPKQNRTKLESRAVKCIMLGYGSSQFTYRLWDIENDKLVIGRHVTFNEKSVLDSMNATPNVVDIVDSEAEYSESIVGIVKGNLNENNNIEQSGTLRRRRRERRQPDPYEASLAEHFSFCAIEFVQNDPITMNDAKRRDDWPNWKDAIDKEYSSLMDNGT